MVAGKAFANGAFNSSLTGVYLIFGLTTRGFLHFFIIRAKSLSQSSSSAMNGIIRLGFSSSCASRSSSKAKTLPAAVYRVWKVLKECRASLTRSITYSNSTVPFLLLKRSGVS